MYMMGHKISSTRGVALIWVILMLFLCGAGLMSMLAVDTIKIMRLQHEQHEENARCHALFGLYSAIGQLQESLGNDCAVTAPARIICDVNPRRSSTIGAWATRSNEKNPMFLGWLSSDENSHQIDSVCQDVMEPSVRISSSVNNEDVYVHARPIIHDGIKVGHYGYHISDESMKANVRLIDHYKKSSDTTAKTVKTICPQTFDTSIFFRQCDSLVQNGELYNVDFLEQIKYLMPDLWPMILSNKDKITLHSYGVLSDVKNGGLKKDLSAIAHDKPSEYIDRKIFEVDNQALAYIPDWDSLLSFITIADGRNKNDMQVIPPYPIFRPQFGVDYISNPSHNDLRVLREHGCSPVIVQILMNIGMRLVDGKVVVTASPKIVMWNPYNCDFGMTNYILDFCIPKNSVHKPYFTVVAKTIEKRELPIQNLDDDLSSITRFKFSGNFPAGTVKIFSLGEDVDWTTDVVNLYEGNASNSYCLLLNADAQADENSECQVLCTNANGMQNLGWNCFYWRLTHFDTDKILQEIAEVDPSLDGTLKSDVMHISTDGVMALSWQSRLKYGIVEDTNGPQGIRWLANGNPRAPYVNRAFCQRYSVPFGGNNLHTGNWNWSSTIKKFDGTSSLDIVQMNYLDGLILYDLPLSSSNVLNVGYLRHANILPFGYFFNTVIGNSRAHPMVPTNDLLYLSPELSPLWPSHVKVESLCDYSYYLNEALFDTYFLSTRIGDISIDESLDFLVNKRFYLLDMPSCNDRTDLSSYLMINGPFNLHTCNPDVWSSAISAVKNIYGNVIFPRFYRRNWDYVWCDFNENDINNLSHEIVDRLISRHVPYLSMSNFINREISDDDVVCARHGILQDVLDDISYERREYHYIDCDKKLLNYDDNSASGFLEEGLPCFVEQADIIQSISHFMTLRGDTFLVRCYGDSVDGHGNIKAHVYCEAVVQRMPEFIDHIANSSNDNVDALSEVNDRFGRRFNVILFRWLNDDQI